VSGRVGAAGVVVGISLVGASAVAATPPPTLFNVGKTVLFARHVVTAGCRRDVRPDRRCSPGAYSSRLTKRVICSSTFRTSSIRNVPKSEKAQLERAYGMPVRSYGRTLEIDHIVSLELGGSNNIANLFPQPGGGRANYHAKDKLENKVHDLVCAGKMSLRSAQRAIASNWVALYRRVFGTSP